MRAMMRTARHGTICSRVALALLLSAGLAAAAESRAGTADVLPLLQQAQDAARAITEDAFLRDTALRGIAGAQAEAGRVGVALDTAAVITDGYLRTNAWRQIAVAQARAGDREAAGKLLEKVRQAAALRNVEPIRANTLIAAAEAQAQIGDVPGALKTAASVGNPRGQAEALRNITLVQAKRGDLKAAAATADAIADERIKAQALHGIAAARAEAGDRDGALQVAAGIRDPYQRTGALRSIALAPAMLKDRAAALDLLKQALDSAGAIHGDVEMADALHGIAIAFLAAGDAAGAFRTAALIESAFAGKPTPEVAAATRSEILRAIVVAQARGGDSQKALRTVGAIKSGYVQSSALAEIAMVQAEKGDQIGAGTTLRRALQAAADIQERAGQAPALTGIAQAQTKVGDRPAAVKTFRQARQVIQMSDDERRKADALLDLAMAQSGAGDFSGAVDTADAIRDVYAKAHAWRVIATAQGAHREQVLSWLAKDGSPVKKAYALLGLAEWLQGRP
jgi:tetratricopeptide (TPR) repeat protein